MLVLLLYMFITMAISLQQHGSSEKIDTGELVNITAQKIPAVGISEVSFISLTVHQCICISDYFAISNHRFSICFFYSSEICAVVF